MQRPIRLADLDLPPYARVLVLAPHPDDFDSVAVTLAHLRDRGNDMRLVVLTGGAAGVTDSYAARTGGRDKDDVREREQKAALRFFGLPPRSASFPRLVVDTDGELRIDTESRQAIEAIVRHADPDVVFTPHTEDTNRGHRDTATLFREIASTTTKPLLALYHRDPKTASIRIDAYTPFGRREAGWKRELLRHHDSQHARNLDTRGSGFDDRILAVNEAIASELGLSEEFAEGFQLELFLPHAP